MPDRRHSAVLFRLAVNRDGNSGRNIVDELRRVILDGAVPPGTPIPVGELADLFGVSAIPVRESLKTLSGEGLVKHRPNVGYAVAQLTVSELAEMYIVRETLESAALAAAVELATDADRAHVIEINELLEMAVRQDDPQSYHRESRRFHIGLTSPSRMLPGTSPNPFKPWFTSSRRTGLGFIKITASCSMRSSPATPID